MNSPTDNSPSLPIIDSSKPVEVKTFDDPGHSLTHRNDQHKLFAALRDVGFVYLQNHAIPPSAQQLLFQHARQILASLSRRRQRLRPENQKPSTSGSHPSGRLAKDHFLRVLYYPETTGSSSWNRFRASLHTDYGTLTLLFDDSHGGLQVRNKAGDYVDAPPLPGTAIVNVGDPLTRWFNDTLKSTEHRVVDPSAFDKSSADIPDIIPARCSIAWFGHPNRDALIDPIKSCCTSDNPKKYEPVYARKHVVERLAKLHKDGKNIKTWTDSMGRDGKQDLVTEVKVGA
ncbi:MAG: hypothetical protein Q9178_003448 [Gyalolechia marmorata]